MTRAELLHLVDYHYWARDRMLDALEPLSAEEYLRPLGNSFGSIRDTAVHILFAEWIWLKRFQGTSTAKGLEAADYPDVATLRAAWRDHEAQFRAFVTALDDAKLSERLAYTFLSGKGGESALGGLILHVINHASYHRGQVTTMVRQVGGKAPLAQDLLFFNMERGV